MDLILVGGLIAVGIGEIVDIDGGSVLHSSRESLIRVAQYTLLIGLDIGLGYSQRIRIANPHSRFLSLIFFEYTVNIVVDGAGQLLSLSIILLKQSRQGISLTSHGSRQFQIVCHRQSFRKRPAVKCVAGVPLKVGECQSVFSIFSSHENLRVSRFVTGQLSVLASFILDENLILVGDAIPVGIYIPQGFISNIVSYGLRDLGIPATKDVAITSGITAITECRRFFIYQQVPMNLIIEDLAIHAILVGDGVLGLLVIRLIVVVFVLIPDGIDGQGSCHVLNLSDRGRDISCGPIKDSIYNCCVLSPSDKKITLVGRDDV